MCWEGSKVLPIEDLKNVVNPPVDAAVVEASCITLHKPKIAAIFKLETFFKCLRCGSRTECNEVKCCNQDCGIFYFLRQIQLCGDSYSQRTLQDSTAFVEMIDKLLGDSSLTLTEEALIRSPILELKYQNNEIVKVVRQ